MCAIYAVCYQFLQHKSICERSNKSQLSQISEEAIADIVKSTL